MTQDSLPWFWLVVGLITAGLIYVLSPILAPFLVAGTLAYLGDPLVDRLEAWRVSRGLAAAIVLGVFLALILAIPFLLLPILETQLSFVAGQLPVYADLVANHLFPWLEANLKVDASLLDMERIESLVLGHWREAGGIAINAIGYLSASGLALAGFLASLVLVPVVSFYMLRDWDGFVAGVHDLLPRTIERTVNNLAQEADVVLGAFLRGQLLVMLCLGGLYWLGLRIVGLELAFLIGVISGLVAFVPYLGIIVGLGAAGVAMLLQTQNPFDLIGVAAVFGIGQLIESLLLTPWLVGDRIGLHPVAVIFAVLAGGQLFGFVGVLLALPTAAVLAVLVRHAHSEYKSSIYYGAGSPEEPRDHT